MAYVNNIRVIAPASAGLFGLFANIAERYARYTVYRETMNELSDLSDRDLADLGLARSTIKSVAYEAAYGN
ncbi:DUF1127 domain-containing protein [Celeribacter sp.]|uniref:DUF1127 domain-containing protein n=1 Tax=Celeribacter sp. TaxID=1890673 RepID=UPI003A8D9B5F